MTDSSARDDEQDSKLSGKLNGDGSGKQNSEASRAERATESEVPLPLVLQQSLCSRCEHRKIITSGKGSVFLLCQVGLTNQHWPKYPPQPVQRCPRFVAGE